MELIYSMLAIWMFIYGAVGIKRFLGIPGMWVVIAIVALFLMAGPFWGVVGAIL